MFSKRGNFFNKKEAQQNTKPHTFVSPLYLPALLFCKNSPSLMTRSPLLHNSSLRTTLYVVLGDSLLRNTYLTHLVLARPRFADIKCPAEYSVEMPSAMQRMEYLTLSPCGALCLYKQAEGYVTGLDTETFSPAFRFKVDGRFSALAISRCKTRCYVSCYEALYVVALPGVEVLRKVDGPSLQVFACGGVVVSHVRDGVSVYDEDLTLLRSLSHGGCMSTNMAVSDCGEWVITSSHSEKNVRLWDVNTGEDVVCVPADWSNHVALSRSASVVAVVCSPKVQLYDWSGAALTIFKYEKTFRVCDVQFTPCGKYVVVGFGNGESTEFTLHQYDVATMSCVRVIQDAKGLFAISPCSRVVVFGGGDAGDAGRNVIVTQHLYPY